MYAIAISRQACQSYNLSPFTIQSITALYYHCRRVVVTIGTAACVTELERHHCLILAHIKTQIVVEVVVLSFITISCMQVGVCIIVEQCCNTEFIAGAIGLCTIGIAIEVIRCIYIGALHCNGSLFFTDSGNLFYQSIGFGYKVCQRITVDNICVLYCQQSIILCLQSYESCIVIILGHKLIPCIDTVQQCSVHCKQLRTCYTRWQIIILRFNCTMGIEIEVGHIEEAHFCSHGKAYITVITVQCNSRSHLPLLVLTDRHTLA